MARSNGDSNGGRMARMGAQVGAQLGARTGSKFGPIATGVASGFGGATGYLAGNVIDDLTGMGKGKRLLPDGGREQDAPDGGVPIEVSGPDEE